MLRSLFLVSILALSTCRAPEPYNVSMSVQTASPYWARIYRENAQTFLDFYSTKNETFTWPSTMTGAHCFGFIVAPLEDVPVRLVIYRNKDVVEQTTRQWTWVCFDILDGE